MPHNQKKRAELYIRYPWYSIFVYNGSTIAHYILGGLGIIIGYSFSSVAGYVFGGLYLIFSFAEMYVAMPVKVCPSCAYFRLSNSICISGLNVVSKKFCNERKPEDFSKRAEGFLCFNNMYIAALMIPIIAIIPALIVNFSRPLLTILIILIILLLFRFFIIFPRIACLHCSAKFKCPQAEKMGVRNR